MDPVIVAKGDSPVVLGLPHTGTYVPEEIAADLNEEGLRLRDTDWHVDRLYSESAPGLHTTVAATFHRYVIDANRDPSGQSLYPGQTTTGLIPRTTFDNLPIWKDGREPDERATAARLAAFHAPYHAALRAELDRVKARHGIAVLFDCHSIRSVIPWLFEGTLPDFNIGTDNGTTCAAEIERVTAEICAASGRTSVLNGRFRGGWTTRHYGRPGDGIHAIQMELAQSSYLATEAPPFAYDEAKAADLGRTLDTILTAISDEALRLAAQR
ncbi:N-formylglutamate deformylase [Pelagovum pacificum]|uniref:N-formylglutamate deformylase n=1 Tax=Pelagovum pacificum TaxID=2588711 RepID=A0A5C5GGJ3_9RHOB|nr:N-formylglutamate deformylase [Pelagovum pacificum]QQA44222.1 N-formylglutamate deformylase [Pelagovum pacificum]TNY32656.1 N-formylglutamate deformylase [Pelagovum pacificum]